MVAYVSSFCSCYRIDINAGLDPSSFSIVISQFFIATLETYYTHTLYLDYINGPTEGVILSCLAFLVSGVCGPGVWDKKIAEIVPQLGSSSIFGRLAIIDIILAALLLFSLVFSIPASMLRIKRDAKKRERSFIPAVYHMLEFIIFFAVEWLWYLQPDSVISRSPVYFVLFMISFGFLFSKIAVRNYDLFLWQPGSNHSYPSSNLYSLILLGLNISGIFTYSLCH